MPKPEKRETVTITMSRELAEAVFNHYEREGGPCTNPECERCRLRRELRETFDPVLWPEQSLEVVLGA